MAGTRSDGDRLDWQVLDARAGNRHGLFYDAVRMHAKGFALRISRRAPGRCDGCGDGRAARLNGSRASLEDRMVRHATTSSDAAIAAACVRDKLGRNCGWTAAGDVDRRQFHAIGDHQAS